MAYNIEEFKNLVSRGGGFARTNAYRVIFSPENTAKELNLLCTSVDMPGRRILSNERQIGLTNKKIAYGFDNGEVSMNFYLLNDNYVRSYFEEWQKRIVDTDTYEVGYYNNYVKNITIQQLRRGANVADLVKSGGNYPAVAKTETQRKAISTEDKVVYSCILEQAYPVAISPVSYNNDANNLITYTVSFAYKSWRSTMANGGSSAIKTYEENNIRNAFDISGIGSI